MLVFIIAATVIAALAATIDWRTGLIPNWLSLGGLVLGILGHTVYGAWVGGFRVGLMEGGASLLGVVLCSLAPGLMYWKGAMGGGDLKLFAALGALLHPMLGIEAQMYSFVAAAVIAPARLAYEGHLGRVFGNSLALLVNPLRPAAKKKPVPAEMMSWFRLGPAIFIGVLATLAVHGYEVIPLQ
jgi:prepilin peptidase CpaA